MKTPLASIRVWAEMVKLSHSVFALPFALTAAFAAVRTLMFEIDAMIEK